MPPEICTVGYEGAEIASFIRSLAVEGIECVIDVRELPLSRKKGFSKSALSSALAEAGIGYLHLRGLGDPKEGRDAAKAGQMALFRKIFYGHLRTAEAKSALSTAVESVKDLKCALLCFEREPDHCHRTIVAHKIATETGQEIRAIRVMQ